MSKTVMALMPHPDDAEYHAGGLLATYAAGGARIILVVSTDGRCGSFEVEPEDLVKIRAVEARRAAEVLGAQPPLMLGYPDFGLDSVPPDELRQKFVRLIRLYQPDVTISEDPYAQNEIHPDHRAVAWAAWDAVHFSHLPLIYQQDSQEGLLPHFINEKYFFSENPERINKFVDIQLTFERKMAALAQHRSQVKFLVEGILQQARRAGLDIVALLGEEAKDPLVALTWAMREWAAQVGASAGMSFAEGYYYERFHPFVERFMAEDAYPWTKK